MMNGKQEIMVALGAAIGANCIPCFDYIYSKAREVNLSEKEIRETIDTAFKVKNGATVFMRNAVEEVTGEVAEPSEPCCEALQNRCCDNG